MSSYSPPSFELQVPKQRQQQQQQQQESKQEEDRVAKGKESQEASPNESQPCERRTSTKRPYPWPEQGAFQSQLESTSTPTTTTSTPRSSIGVHSILNPTDSQTDKRDSNNDNTELLRPPTLPPSPQQRRSSSPLVPISKSMPVKPHMQHGGGSAVSPQNLPRRFITPVSPGVSYATINSTAATASASVSGPGSVSGSVVGASAGKVRVSQSPFVQDLSAGVYTAGSSAPTTTSAEPTLTTRFSPKLEINIPPGRNPQHLQLPRHSISSTFPHSRRPSGGLATNPSSQASSPSTPHSTFSTFTQSSPSITSGLLPPPSQALSLSSVESVSQSPYMAMESLSRTASRMSGSRFGDEHQQPGVAFPSPVDVHQYNSPMIPVTLDFKSGSRSQAEKRKANSDASRRFRNRKKNEAVLEQKISQLNEQMQYIIEERDSYRTERDFYRAERDFFRETLGRHVGMAQLPHRSSSPAPSRRYQQSTVSPGSQSAGEQHGGEMMLKSVSAGTSSSLASGSPNVLPTLPAPVPTSKPLSYASAAAGQHPPEAWQDNNNPTTTGDYQHSYLRRS